MKYGRCANSLVRIGVLTLAILIVAISCSKPRGDDWRVERDGTVSFLHGLGPSIWFSLDTTPLPKDVLNRVKAGIKFALKTGAARKINNKDFYHGHMLFNPQRPGDKRTVENVDAILFHTQEINFYDNESFKKRNILIGPQGIEMLHCLFTQHEKGKRPHCTVSVSGIREKRGYTLGRPKGPYFLNVDEIPPQYLERYRHNIVHVKGRKVLVGYPVF